jgi:hypothetical protein
MDESLPPPKDRKLVKEDRWSRVFEEQANTLAFESKFYTDGLSISVNELEKGWKEWDDEEKLSFVGAFTQKPEFSTEDEEIFEFLMKNGDGRTWTMLALSLRFLSNRRMVLDFLVERMKSDFRPKSNFAQTLGVLGDPSAIPALLTEYDNDRFALAAAQDSVDTDLLFDFLCCCSALQKLGAQGNYINDIKGYLEHPDQIVRRCAARQLAHLS